MALEQIGQKLKAAREGQNLSLRHIHDRTKIPIAHLQSIDAGLTDDLPEPVYVCGFIKRYADCVGLNGQSLADEYRQQTDLAASGQQPWGQQLLDQPVIVNPEYISRLKIEGGRPTFKTIYFNALWIVIVVGLIAYLAMTQINNQANQQDPSLQSLKEATAHYQNPAPQPATAASSQENSAKASADANLALTASSHVWVEVKSAESGESLFTGYLEQGERRDFQDRQGLRIRVSNGGSVSVDYQGKQTTFGQPGVVAERLFAASPATAKNNPSPAPENQASIPAPTTAGQVATPTTTVSSPAPAGHTTTPTTAAGSPQDNPTPASPAVTAATGAAPTTTKQAAKHSSPEPHIMAQRESRYRHLDEVPSRQYIPGESLPGDTHSIDVPYRYSEGRLDAE